MEIKILDSMKGIQAEKFNDADKCEEIIEALIQEFINDKKLEDINFNEVQLHYKVQLSLARFLKVMKKIGYTEHFEGMTYDWANYYFIKQGYDTISLVAELDENRFLISKTDFMEGIL